jgi:hypothetical protein
MIAAAAANLRTVLNIGRIHSLDVDADLIPVQRQNPAILLRPNLEPLQTVQLSNDKSANPQGCRNMPAVATKGAMRASHGIAIYRE